MLFLVSWLYQAPQSIMVVLWSKSTPLGACGQRGHLYSVIGPRIKHILGKAPRVSLLYGSRGGGYRYVITFAIKKALFLKQYLGSTILFNFQKHLSICIPWSLLFTKTKKVAYLPKVLGILSGTDSFKQALCELSGPEILTAVLHNFSLAQ